VSKKDVVMTIEQAKQAKLAKGFALEPVLPGSLEAVAPLPEGTKRDRKKADIFGLCSMQALFHLASSVSVSVSVSVCVCLCVFPLLRQIVMAGYEDQQKQKAAAVSKPKEHKVKHKSKSKPAAQQGIGVSSAPRPAPVHASPKLSFSTPMPVPVPVPVHVGPSPYEDKRRVLQERLKRIEAQIRKLDRLSKPTPDVGAATPHRGAPVMLQQVRLPSAVPPHMQALAHETPMSAGTKRRASEVSGSGGGGSSTIKKSKSSSSSKVGTVSAGAKLGNKAEIIMSSLMENPASKAYFNRPVDPAEDGLLPPVPFPIFVSLTRFVLCTVFALLWNSCEAQHKSMGSTQDLTRCLCDVVGPVLRRGAKLSGGYYGSDGFGHSKEKYGFKSVRDSRTVG
jgi:hypothetical protein